MYLDNKYTKWYISIVSTAESRDNSPDMYLESHHIIPKCMGGSNHRANLVKLTAKEHFICHLLLVRMVENRQTKAKLSYAAWQMTRRHTVCSRMYQQLRDELSENTKNLPKSEQHKANLRKPKSNTENMRGGQGAKPGFKHSAESKVKMSEKKKGKYVGENNPFFQKKHTEETLQKYRDLYTGVPLTAEHRQKISDGLKGRPTWNKGIPQDVSAKEKASASLRGRITVNDGANNKRIRPELLPTFIANGWIRGKLKKG